MAGRARRFSSLCHCIKRMRRHRTFKAQTLFISYGLRRRLIHSQHSARNFASSPIAGRMLTGFLFPTARTLPGPYGGDLLDETAVNFTI
jgi:hypothetical protein